MSKFSSFQGNISKLAANSYRAIDEGAYESDGHSKSHSSLNLRKAIISSPHAALITEVKYSSPSKGKLPSPNLSSQEIAAEMLNGGACALSILTQPHLFDGSIAILSSIRKIASVPLIMKDIIVSRVQIDAGKRAGADCILLIKSIFDRNLGEESFESLIDYAHKRDLQILAEAHSNSEYIDLLRMKLPIVGINNRNLDDLMIDPDTTERLLNTNGKGSSIIVAESGISSPSDIKRLSRAGADAFLVGTSIMSSPDIRAKVSELCIAI